MSTASPPLIPSDDDKGPMINAVVWVGAGIALVLVLLRLYTRIIIVRKLGMDDHIMVLATILNLTGMSMVSYAVHAGFGRRMSSLPPTRIVTALKWSLISQMPIVLALQIARISIAIFLLRIFSKHVSLRRFLYVWTTINTIAAVVPLIVQYSQCRPARRLWDKSVNGTCLDPTIERDLQVLSSSITAFTDLTFAVFPIYIVWNLQMKLTRKLGLAFLLGLCLLAMIATIVAAVEIYGLSSSADVTYDTAGMYLWVICDNHLIIAAGCIPTIRPLFRQTERKPANHKPGSDNMERVKKVILQRPDDPFYQLPSNDDGTTSTASHFPLTGLKVHSDVTNAQEHKDPFRGPC